MVPTRSFPRERRSAERFLLALPAETDRGPGITRDVSVSGLYLVSAVSLQLGEHLDLTLTVPDPDCLERPSCLLFKLRGRVVRVEEVPEGTGAGIALDEDSPYLALAS